MPKVCSHISQVFDEINSLTKDIGDMNSSLYRKLGPISDKEDIKTSLKGGFWSGYQAQTDYKTYYFHYISQSALYERTERIGRLLNGCNCYSELTGKNSSLFEKYENLANSSVDKDKAEKLVNELLEKDRKNVEDYNNLKDEYNGLVNKYNNLIKDSARDYEVLKDKYNKLVDEYNDKNTDYHDMKEKYDDTKEELHNEKLKHANESGNEKLKHAGEKSRIQLENARLQEKLESKSSELIRTYKQLEDTKKELNSARIEGENKIMRLENKLDEKNVIHNQKIENLNSQLTTLRLESGKKDEEIRNLKNQAKSSDKRAEKSQEELLTEKIHSKKRGLELFATELKIDLEKIHGLSRYHERLFRARKSFNQANVETHEDNIEKIKKELRGKGISVVNIQELCEKCEKVAEFRWELEQMQQQYQACQEQPTNR